MSCKDHGGELFMLKAIRYRVQNFRNIDDIGWIALERVTIAKIILCDITEPK